LRVAERTELPVGGIVPIAPAGLHMAGWFSAIEGEWLVRLLRFSPVPVPDRIVKPIVGRVYRTLVFGDPRGADPDVVDAFSTHLASFARSMGVLDVGRRLLPELGDPFELDRIDCPLLLIWGERDRMVFTTGAERVLRTVDYSDIEVIPDCGHCPQIEVPDLLAELLLGFPGNLEFPAGTA
jgi:pimeloyl-ACP methyl ester carboxylesterase